FFSFQSQRLVQTEEAYQFPDLWTCVAQTQLAAGAAGELQQEGKAGAVGARHPAEIELTARGPRRRLPQRLRFRCEAQFSTEHGHYFPSEFFLGVNASPPSMRLITPSRPDFLISALIWLRKLATSEIASTEMS